MSEEKAKAEGGRMKAEPKRAGGLGSFWTELRQRKVVRAGIAYLVVGLAVMEGGDIVLGNLGAPQWVVTGLILLVIAGFPIALVVSWVYELTPGGIRNTDTVREEQAEASGKEHSQSGHPALLLFMAAAVPTLIFGAGTLYFFLKAKSATDELQFVTQSEFIALTEKSIAVLPLENLSPDPENAFFADAIHAEILSNLGNISDLIVRGSASVRQYRDTLKTPKQLGEELAVNYIVEGSVFRDQSQAAIVLNLTEVQSERQTWSKTYERSTNDLFSIRSAVAEDVAEQLHAILSPEEAEQVAAFPTQNREAYDSFLRAQQTEQWDRNRLLERATTLDPNFYDAWSSLCGNAYFGFTGWGKNEPELITVAQGALQQLMRLRPEARSTLMRKAGVAFHINKDLEAALRYRLKQKEMSGDGRDVGWTYLQLGDLQKARMEMEVALPKEPLNPDAHRRLYTTYACLGMWEQARTVLRTYLDRVDSMPESLFGRSISRFPSLRGTIAQHNYLQHGGLDALVKTFDEWPEHRNDLWGQLWMNLVVRDYANALQVIEDIRSDPISNRFNIPGVGMELLFRGQMPRSLDVEPLSLLSALVHFVQGDKDQLLQATTIAKTYWEERVAAYHIVDPDYYASLAICYALEGERGKLEDLIPKIRELTATYNWQFRAQAECEVKLAIAYLVLGEENQALELLEKATQLHSPMFLQRELELWFVFDRLKGKPRYEALLRGEVLTQKDEGGGLKDENSDVEAPEKSIAVLPLENMSPDPDNAFFADGVQMDVLDNLNQIEELFVIGRTSTLQYRNTVKSLQQIGQELGVRHLLEGSVRRAGDRVKIAVQLNESESGKNVWSETYDRSLDDYFEIQSEVAKTIADRLRAVLSPEEVRQIDHRPTTSQEAYDLFVKFRSKEDGEDLTLEEGISLLEKAVNLDPNFGEAWAQLAIETSFYWRVQKHRNDPQLIGRAMNAMEQAENLGKGFAYVPYAKASFVWNESEDLESSIEHLLEAVELSPTFVWARINLGRRYHDLGRLNEAEFHFKEAVRLDPLAKNHADYLFRIYHLQNKWDEAENVLRVNLERNRDDPHWLRRQAVLNYSKSGNRDAFVRAIESDPLSFSDHKLKLALVRRDFGDSLKWIDEKTDRRFLSLFLSWGGFTLPSLDLGSALIWFQLDNQEKWREQATNARIYLEEIIQTNLLPDPSSFASLAVCHALQGDPKKMDTLIAKARDAVGKRQISIVSQANTEITIAIAYLVQGDVDKALETLEQLSQSGNPIMLNRVLDLWFIFDRLKGNPRFEALLKNQ